MSQGFLSRFDVGATGMRRLLNWWPPFRGAGTAWEYLVWDKMGTVRFRIPEERIAEARAATASGEKHEPKFVVEIVDGDGVTVADVKKTLYIRRKKN